MDKKLKVWKSNLMNNKFMKLLAAKKLLCVMILVLLAGVNSYGQDCPSFRVANIKDVNSSPDGGAVTITITSGKLYTVDNFQIRQKENGVTGPIGYEVDFQISRNEIVISGLKKSDELLLKEYVVLFSDPGCDNSQIKEVGTFQIK